MLHIYSQPIIMRTKILTWTCYFVSSNIYVHQANESLKFSPLQFVHGQELNISHLRIFYVNYMFSIVQQTMLEETIEKWDYVMNLSLCHKIFHILLLVIGIWGRENKYKQLWNICIECIQILAHNNVNMKFKICILWPKRGF